MFKRALRGALHGLLTDGEPPAAQEDDPHAPTGFGETRLEQVERINREQFEVIERLARERDQWKRMYFDEGRKHANAQALLARGYNTQKNRVVACYQFLKARDPESAAALDRIVRDIQVHASDDPITQEVLEFGRDLVELGKVAIAEHLHDWEAKRAQLAEKMDALPPVDPPDVSRETSKSTSSA